MAQEGKVKRSRPLPEQKWRERVEAWRRSGQSQEEFCRTQGICPRGLSRWKIRLSRQGQEPSVPGSSLAASSSPLERSPEVLGWTEIGWPTPEGARGQAMSSGSEFEVVLPRGWSVRLGPRFEAEPLRRLLSVLEGR